MYRIIPIVLSPSITACSRARRMLLIRINTQATTAIMSGVRRHSSGLTRIDIASTEPFAAIARLQQLSDGMAMTAMIERQGEALTISLDGVDCEGSRSHECCGWWSSIFDTLIETSWE